MKNYQKFNKIIYDFEECIYSFRNVCIQSENDRLQKLERNNKRINEKYYNYGIDEDELLNYEDTSEDEEEDSTNIDFNQEVNDDEDSDSY